MNPDAVADWFDEIFVPEQDAGAPPSSCAGVEPWTVLVVDDEPSFHAAIRLALDGAVVDDRPLRILSAHSERQARESLAAHADVALALLDVVMERDSSGWSLVEHVREARDDQAVQIVIVSGQPSRTPLLEAVTRFEINGFRLKSELTAEQLFVLACSAIRTYRAMRELASERSALHAQALRLEEAEERSRVVFRTAPDAILLCDDTGTITECNPASERMFGRRRDELVGAPLTCLMPTRFRTPHEGALARLREGAAVRLMGVPVTLEGMRRDGGEFPIEVVLGQWTASGRQHFSAIVRDISGRQAVERERERHRRNLEQMVHARSSELGRVVRRSQALLDLPRLAEAVDESRFLRQALALVGELTGSTVGFVHLVSEDQRSLELLEWSGPARDRFPLPWPATGAGVDEAGRWADALRRRAPVVVDSPVAADALGGLPPPCVPLSRLISVPVLQTNSVRLLFGLGGAPASYKVFDVETAELFASAVWRILSLRRAGIALEEERRRFRATFDHAAVGIGIVSTDGHWMEVNRRLCAIVGRDAPELRSTDFRAITHPDDVQTVLEPVRKVLAGEIPGCALLARYVHRSGRVVLVDLSVTLIRNAAGAPAYFICVVEDVTERRATEAQLVKLSSAVEQSSESIVITDLNGAIEYVNAAAQASSGYSREDLIGRNPRMLKSGRTPARVYEQMWNSLGSGGQWRGILNNRRKDGSEYVEFVRIQPIRGADGSVSNYVAVKEDITERRQMGEELERYRNHLEDLVGQRTHELARAKRAAEEASRAKSAFLATMSHEIRTPINGVIGMIEVLGQSALTPYQQDIADTIRDSSSALLGIIDDVLDFSKIEAGKLEIERAPLSIAAVVEGAADALQPLAAGRGVRLSVFVDPGLPVRLAGDAVRLRQILTNLLGNAIKFSSGLERRGEVDVRALAGRDGTLSLVVEDNGIGMRADDLARLFAPFTQAENDTTRRYGGTGLGLSICRRLVDLLDGRIDVDSEVGRGSRFAVVLPLDALPARAPDDEAGLRLEGIECHVLAAGKRLASDWCAYLESAGASCRCWGGVGQFEGRPAPARDSTTVLVADATTPDVERLLSGPARAEGRTGIVLVGEGRRHAPRLQGGIVVLDGDCMRRRALLQAVALAAGRIRPDQPGERPVVERSARTPPSIEQAVVDGNLILVAEDNEVNRKLIRHQLALSGYAAELAEDGARALELWRSGRYGLLLTDLHMPRLDGYGLARAIRAEEEGATRRPILALTADAFREESEQCRSAGIDECLVKPVRLEQLRAALDRWLGPRTAPRAGTDRASGPARAGRDAAQAPEGGAGETRSACPRTPDAGPAPVAFGAEPPVLDRAVLDRLVGGDASVAQEAERDYLESAGRIVDEIAVRVDAGDWIDASNLAHRLKSSSRAVGALALGEACARLEQCAQDGDAGRVPGCHAEVRAAHAALLARIAGLPAREPHGEAVVSGRPAPPPLPSVVLVDDDRLHLDLLAGLFNGLGVHDVRACESGETALVHVETGGSSRVLVMLDLGMPRMDGVEFIRHLASRGFRGALALVSGADERIRESAVALAESYGLNLIGNLPKPVGVASLRELLAGWRDSEPKASRAGHRAYTPAALLDAIESHQLELWFQPQVSAASGALVGVEALARWRHPRDGLVLPDEFIALAESHGLVERLTREVVGLALEQARRWRVAGRRLRMSVNVSIDTLERLEFADYVLAELDRFGIDGGDLVLEITESRLPSDARIVLDVVTRLRLRGVGLSIDDFGTGNSSLAQLRDIPFVELKVDKGFVHGARERATLSAIFRASVGLAHQLRMSAVGEGVESLSDWEFARAAGCDLLQGYFVARPMPAEGLEAWERAWRSRELEYSR